MRIAFTLLSGIGYGGMTYFRNLLPVLTAIDRTNEYHCFIPGGHSLASSLHTPNVVFHEVVPSQTSVLERFRYEQFVLPSELRRFRIDLLYTAKNIAVFRAPCPQVIAIRNMEPFRYRAFENPFSLNVQSRIKWELTKRSIRLASGIIAVSNAVRDAVIERFSDAAARVRVVYNGTPEISPMSLRGAESDEAISFNEQQDRHAPLRSARDDYPFVLCASKFVAYANQLGLVEGYARLVTQRPDVPPLWFAGGIHDARYFERVRDRVAALRLTERVRFLSLVPQEDLHTLMRQATAFLFPSVLESCPHTLLEAMACGVPIATSNVPPMPELCGDAAMYFNPRNPDTIASAMMQLLDDAPRRDRLIASGRARVEEFTWEKTAKGLLEAFDHVRVQALDSKL